MPERRAPTRRRSCTVAFATAMVLMGGAPAAYADDVSTAELRRRVERALVDPGAAAEVRAVDSVDGRPVDLERALAGATGPRLEARLRALDPGAAPAATTTGPAGEPRAEARRILEQRRFHPNAVPRPFRGIFRTLGRWLRPITSPIGRLWSDLWGDALTAGVLAAAVVGLAALASVRIIRRRSAAGVLRAGRGGGARRHDDPDDLERRAAEAERAGNLDLALRLRFRAGLARLDRAGVVADRPALTTGALIRQLRSEELRALTAAFEEVAYGGRPASPDDVAAARTGWPRVLDEVAR